MTASTKASGRKRKQVVMSESDESGGEESPPDSGSDWSAAGKEAAAEAAEAGAEDDDDVSMADDSDNAPGSADTSKENGASRKRQKPSSLQVSPKMLTMLTRANFANANAFSCVSLMSVIAS